MKLKARLLNRCTKLLTTLQALLQHLRRDTTQLALDPKVAEDLNRLLEKRLGKIQQAVNTLKFQVEERAETAIDKTLTDALVDIKECCYRLRDNICNDSCKKLTPIKHFKCLDDDVRDRILDQLQTMEHYASLRYFLPDEPEPDAKVLQLAEQLKEEQQQAHQTGSFIKALHAISELGRQRKAKVSCFISYAWASKDRPWEQWVQPFLKTMCNHLKRAGVQVYLDVNDSPEGNDSHHHMDRIADCRYVILIGTESLLDKFNLGVSSVCYELNLIRQRRRKDAENGLYKVIPLVVSGTMDTALPADFERFTVIKTCGGQYVATLKDLLRQLYDYGTQHQAYLSIWQTLVARHPAWFNQSDTLGFADFAIDSVTHDDPVVLYDPVVPLPINRNTVNTLSTDWQSALKARYSAQRFIPSLFAQESVVTQGLPIENYYVNLALITEQEQQQKEKAQKTQEFGANPNLLELGQNETNTRLSKDFIPSESPSHEQLFAVQTPIELTELFKVCDKANDKRTNASHHLLLLGGAGIGKSTLCQYIAYQWAQGHLWSDRYDGVVWLRLRDLNDTYFPVNREYSLEEIIARLVFGCKDTYLIPGFDRLMRQLTTNKARFLFLLDGYDELPTVTQKNQWHSILEELFSFPEVIVTSRPQPIQHYQPDLAVQVVGFTDANIDTYIQQFFGAKPQKLARLEHFLKEQSVIKSLLHIPINAELFCQLWQSEELKEAELSFTELYQHITHWLFKRNLTKQGTNIIQILNREVESYCGQLPLYLEQLAWQAMQMEKIYLPETLMSQVIEQVDKETESRAKIPSESLTKQLQTKLTEISGLAQQLNYPEVFSHLVQSFNSSNTNSAQPKRNRFDELRLHSGFLRSTFSQVRECYFMHLSFQEFFAARYVAKVIQNAGSQGNKDYEAFQTFFKANKFNSKLQVVWWFVAGLLKDDSKALDRYFHLLLQEPRDILVVNELAFFTHCLEQSNLAEKSRIGQQILKEVAEQIFKIFNSSENSLTEIKENINVRLSLCPRLLQNKIIPTLIERLNNINEKVNKSSIGALVWLGKNAATDDVIEKLITLLNDNNKMNIALGIFALQYRGEKVANDKVINILVNLISNGDKLIKFMGAYTLGQMGEKAATDKVIKSLVNLLYSSDNNVKKCAAEALSKFNGTVALNKWIENLLISLGSTNKFTKIDAAYKLSYIGETAATNKVIEKLLILLGSKNKSVRSSAVIALASIGKKAATDKVIEKIFSLLSDKEQLIRSNATICLGNFGEKAATHKVIKKLVELLDDPSFGFKGNTAGDAAYALGLIGEKVVTEKIVDKIYRLLHFRNMVVKTEATYALGKIGKKAAQNKVVNKLLSMLGDEDYLLNKNIIEALKNLCSFEKQINERVVAALIGFLEAASDWLRYYAASALWQINEIVALKKILEVLITLLNNSNLGLKHLINEELKSICAKPTLKKQITILEMINNNNLTDLYPYVLQLFNKVPLTVKHNQLSWYEPTQGRMSLSLGPASLKVWVANLQEVLSTNINITPFLIPVISRETTLMRAAAQGDLVKVQRLVAEGVDTRCMDEYGKMAVNKVHGHLKVLEWLIAHHQPIDRVFLENVLIQLEGYQGNANSQKEDEALLNQLVLLLTGKIKDKDTDTENASSLKQAQRKRLLAHFHSFGDNDEQQLEGFIGREFLILHTYHLLQLIAEVKLGHYDHQLHGSRLAMVSQLKRELLLTVQAAHFGILSWLVKDQPTLRSAVAQAILSALAELAPGEELIYQTGYTDQPAGHCIYVAFRCERDRLVVRVDNLGAGIGKGHTQRKVQKQGHEVIRYQPYFVAEYNKADLLQNPALKHYLEEIIVARNLGKDTSLSKIYPLVDQQTAIAKKYLSTWPAKKAQIVGNCVVRNFLAGAHVRLGKSEHRLLRHWESSFLTYDDPNQVPADKSTMPNKQQIAPSTVVPGIKKAPQSNRPLPSVPKRSHVVTTSQPMPVRTKQPATHLPANSLQNTQSKFASIIKEFEQKQQQTNQDIPRVNTNKSSLPSSRPLPSVPKRSHVVTTSQPMPVKAKQPTSHLPANSLQNTQSRFASTIKEFEQKQHQANQIIPSVNTNKSSLPSARPLQSVPKKDHPASLAQPMPVKNSYNDRLFLSTRQSNNNLSVNSRQNKPQTDINNLTEIHRVSQSLKPIPSVLKKSHSLFIAQPKGVIKNTRNQSQQNNNLNALTKMQLAKLLANELGIADSEVLFGATIPQLLIDVTGIEAKQRNPQFDHHSQQQCTVFYLNFSSAQTKQQFINFYQTKYPGVVLRSVEISGRTRIDFDTRLLVEAIIPLLKAFRTNDIHPVIPKF